MGHPEPGTRWGILGGSFDPIHLGHLALAEAFLATKPLDGVLFVPAFHHPFKGTGATASFDNRLAMIQAAITGNAKLAASPIEQFEELSGYSIETVEALKAEYPKTNFVFLMGADILAILPKWHRIDELLALVPCLAASRPGSDLQKIPEQYRTRIELVEANTPDISSTDIRTLLAIDPDDSRLKSLLPAPVIAYITEQGLYQ